MVLNDTWQLASGFLLAGRADYGYANDRRKWFSICIRKPGQVTINLTGYIGQGAQLGLFYQGIDDRVDSHVETPYRITHDGPTVWCYVASYTESA